MPQSGVDWYVGTCPCSPWPRQGHWAAFGHPEAHALHIGSDTIVSATPVVFVIDTRVMPGNKATADTNDDMALISHGFQAGWTIQTFEELNPWCVWVPDPEKRLLRCGRRQDIGTWLFCVRA